MVVEAQATVEAPVAQRARSIRRRRTKALSAGLVLAAHLGLAYLVGLSLRGAALVEREGGGGMTVGLVGPLQGKATGSEAIASSSVSEPTPTSPESTQAEASPPDPAPSESTQPHPSGGASSEASGSAGGGAGEASSFVDPRAHASVLPAAPPLDEAAAQLWLQVARCWNAQRTHIPLTLAIALDEHGALLGEPEPVRPAGAAPGAALLAEEAVASHALKACAPYRVAIGSPSRHEVRFAGDLSRGDTP